MSGRLMVVGIGPGDETPECPVARVQCLRDPCGGLQAVCRDRVCTTESR